MASTPSHPGGFIPEFFPNSPEKISPIKCTTTNFMIPSFLHTGGLPTDLPTDLPSISPMKHSPGKQRTTTTETTKEATSIITIKQQNICNKQAEVKKEASVKVMVSKKRQAKINEYAKKLAFKKRQRKCIHHVNKDRPILLDQSQNISQENSSKPWMKDLKLSNHDRDILLSPTSWLTDSIIDASQTLLKDCNPAVPGLESVACALTLTHSVQRGEFVQILNTGSGHWVVITTIGAPSSTVYIYDSLYSYAGPILQKQIASILAIPQSQFQIKFIDVPIQSGSSDCGIFAVAYATALVLGKKPEQFHFNQVKMREHQE